jgi:tetratricopeptide (TPR) repeat protein
MRMAALFQNFISGPLASCASSVLSLLAAAMPLANAHAAETNATAAPPVVELQVTNIVPVAYVTPEAIEQLRRDFEHSLSSNSAVIAATLDKLVPALKDLKERQSEAADALHRTVLWVAGIFCTASLFGLVGITWILVRALGRFTEMATQATATRPQLLAAPVHAASLGPGETAAVPAAPSGAEQAGARFQSAIDQLQKRIHELEHSLHESMARGGGDKVQPLAPGGRASSAASDSSSGGITVLPVASAADTATPESTGAAHAAVLIGKGQALLNLDATEDALACFNEVLEANPNNAEALVRRGLAFEKLQNWEQALDSYDRAIAADHSLTIAYLYKGGVCNRLQRHREALESYEQALQTESRVRAS